MAKKPEDTPTRQLPDGTDVPDTTLIIPGLATPVTISAETQRALTKTHPNRAVVSTIMSKINTQMNKRYGGSGPALQWLVDLPEKTVFSTGIDHLDGLLHGGLAHGSLVHIYGKAQAGRTSLALSIAGQADSVLYIDGERKVTLEWARQFGGHGDYIIAQPACLEEAFELTRYMLNAGTQLVILDSLPSLPALRETDETDYSKNTGMAQTAGFLSRKLPVIKTLLYEKQATLVIINGVRANINAMPFGEQFHTFGGLALPAIADTALLVARKSWIKQTVAKEDRVIGHELVYQVIKCSHAAPQQSGGCPLVFGKGFVPYDQLKDAKKELIDDEVSVQEIADDITGGSRA